MLPTIEFGPWQLSTYHVFLALALTLPGAYSLHRLLKLPYPPALIGRGLLLTFLAGIAGGLLGNWLTNLAIQAVSGPLAPLEGLSVIWAMVCGGVVGALYCWKYKGPLGQVFDLGGLPVPLAQAIGRLGCVAAGCCYGKITDSWLGLYLPDEHGYWAVRYPTQLLSGLADLLIFLSLLALERYGLRRAKPLPRPFPDAGRGDPPFPDREGGRGVRSCAPAPNNLLSKDKGGEGRLWPFDGFLSLLYVVLFSLKRFWMGFLRESAVPVLGPLSEMHLQALIALAIATALILWNLYRRRRKEVQNR